MKAKIVNILILVIGIVMSFFITYFQNLWNNLWLILSFVMLIVGIYLLLLWWDLLVDWSVSIAKKFNISPLVIWLTIISFWTSAPEFFINVLASLKWESQLLLSNIIWSNLANILLILWVSSLVAKWYLKVRDSTLYREIPFSLLAVFVLFFLVNDIFIDWANANILSHVDGLVLLSFFIVFLYYIYSLMQTDRKSLEENDEDIKLPFLLSIVLVVLWILWLYFGGEMVVNNATWFAEKLWISSFLIWATIVAIWTSLPELVASVVSSWKWYTDMAIWNVIWSNIFNIFWIWWVSAVINKISFDSKYDIDILILIVATLILFFSIYFSKSKSLNKLVWFIFVILYVFYIGFVIWRW